jgi:hypothetical protein
VTSSVQPPANNMPRGTARPGRTRPREPRAAPERALKDFVEAVVAFSDDSRMANLERYLASSKALDESRRSRKTVRGTPVIDS